MNRDQALASLRAFLGETNDVVKIVELCHLYPEKSWKKWADHLGNYLQIKKNKKTISVEQNPQSYAAIVTDLFFKAHPKKIANISKKAFVSLGHDNESKYSVCFIWFLGCDNRLRLVTSHNNHWIKNSAPLICGVDTLAPIVRTLNITDFVSSDILKIKGPIAAQMVKSWATKWPPSKEFLEAIKLYDTHQNISELICNQPNLE